MMLHDHTTPDLRAATLAELARMAHDAEESDDDVTSIGIMQELDARGPQETKVFRDLYMTQWRQRMGSNVQVEGAEGCLQPEAPARTPGSAAGDSEKG